MIIVGIVAVLASGIVWLLVDEWRRPPLPPKRAVNQARFKRLHVIDREPDDDAA